MSLTIELYDFEAAACPTKVRWLLAELGLGWHRTRVDLMNYEHKRSDYLRVHPRGLVPAARIDGVTLTDADLILKHLCERADGGARFWPEDPNHRRRINRILDRITSFHRAYGAIFYAEALLPAQRRRKHDLNIALARISNADDRAQARRLIEHGIAGVESYRARVADGFDHMEQRLTNSLWLLGDRITIADIALFPYVNSPLHSVTDIWFERMEHLTDWLRRMRARAAYTAAIVKYPYPKALWKAIRTANGGGGFRSVGNGQDR